MDPRRRARELAEQALADRDPLTWFERLYAEASRGEAVVPWDDGVANPMLVRWLDAHPPPPGTRAIDVGCGLGDNTAELARRGLRVSAFDVSRTAVEAVRARLGPDIDARARPADEAPLEWRGAFDLVVEIYTLQVLPPPARGRAADGIATLLRPGGTLLLICRGRHETEAEGALPWPLTRSEIEAFATRSGLQVEAFEDRVDEEQPPVRRFVVTLKRPVSESSTPR